MSTTNKQTGAKGSLLRRLRERILAMSEDDHQRMAEGLSKAGLNFDELGEMGKHSEVVATACTSGLQPFARDINFLGPADGQKEVEAPDWVSVAALTTHLCVICEAMRGDGVSQMRYFGRLLAMMSCDWGELPFELPGEEAKESLHKVKDYVSQQVIIAQTQALRLPEDLRFEYFRGFTEGLLAGRNLEASLLAQIEVKLCFLVVWGWRHIATLRSVTEFHDWLTQILGHNCTGSLKRIQNFCADIGLKFKGRGRPRKLNTHPLG